MCLCIRSGYHNNWSHFVCAEVDHPPPVKQSIFGERIAHGMLSKTAPENVSEMIGRSYMRIFRRDDRRRLGRHR